MNTYILFSSQFALSLQKSYYIMKKGSISIISILFFVGIIISCNGTKTPEKSGTPTDSISSTKADSMGLAVDNMEGSDSLLYANEDAEDESLNDIRFANFKDEDWLDNEYIRTLRRYIDDFNNRKIEDEELEPHRNLLKGKFVIGNVEPFMLGGLFIQITFIDHPENVFSAWVYSDVDPEKRTVSNYNVHHIRLEKEKLEFTREQILQEMEIHPEMKLW